MSTAHRDRWAERISAASYGTVLIIAALLFVEPADVTSGWGWELVVGVGAATWLAHLYADVLGNHVRTVEATRAHELRKAMVDGLPTLLSAVAPALVLLLGRLGALEPRPALWTALIVALLQLVAIGALVGVISDQRADSWRFAVMATVLGVAVVFLMVLLGH